MPIEKEYKYDCEENSRHVMSMLNKNNMFCVLRVATRVLNIVADASRYIFVFDSSLLSSVLLFCFAC